MTVNPISVPSAPLSRPATTVSAATTSFVINAATRSYKHQYANIYYVRLKILREFVEERARKLWQVDIESPKLVPRVLDVVKSQLCYIVGTVYMDMALKPNVLEDIGRDHSIPAPPPRDKFHSPDDGVMLEDESGRVRLVGKPIRDAKLVTGVIIGALGMETDTGDFEVKEMCFPGMAPQVHGEVIQKSEESMDVDEPKAGPSNLTASSSSDEWIAVVSGLDIGSPSPADAQIQMLVEYLTSESGGLEDQLASSRISRLIIAGNSLSAVSDPVIGIGKVMVEKKPRRYGYDSTNFSPHPCEIFGAHLLDIARVMPIHLLPGYTDPSGVTLPQQPFPRAMFGAVSSFSSFTCETNPTYLRVASATTLRTILVNSGQPLDDMYKYLPSPPATRLSIAEMTLKWRHMAPTAPDTLWCHPYFAADPFIMTEGPDLYIIGCQPQFATKMVVERPKEDNEMRCRIVLVPEFAETGTLVLINVQSLEVKTVQFAVEGMAGIEDDDGQEDPET